MDLTLQIIWLFVLAIPVACVAWTITHEEIFREPRDYCKRQSKTGETYKRKFFYIFTCEYCLSHYVAIAFLALTQFHLLYLDWRGYLIALFSLVWVANLYMGIYNRLRLDIHHERVEIQAQEQDVKRQKAA